MLLVMAGCANVVAPSGGPMDEDPPVVVRSSPELYSTHFQGGEVRIFFDEFVELRDLRQQFLVSPPIDPLPEVSIRGRSLVMKVEAELRPNTTYGFFFGNALRDITEGNAIENFQYVVSTGDYVDSLSVRGQVRNAFSLEPEEGVFVMLYDSIVDSIPFIERPVYLARTDKQGRFHIGNMRQGEYLMFALADNNANFLYDLPAERIAFSDSLVSPVFIPYGRFGKAGMPETLQTDENDVRDEGRRGPAEEETDEEEASGDSPPETEDANPEAQAADISAFPFHTLFMFQEMDTVQRVTSGAMMAYGQLRLSFRVAYDSAWVRPLRPAAPSLDTDSPDLRTLTEFNTRRDTLSIWIHEPVPDTLRLEVLDRDRVLDTLILSTQLRQPRGRSAPEEKPDSFSLIVRPYRALSAAWPWHEALALRTSRPLESIDMSRIQLWEDDSLPYALHLAMAGRARREIRADSLLKPATAYLLELFPGALRDIYGFTHDSLVFRLRTDNPDDYGMLIMQMEFPARRSPWLIQLLDKQSQVLQEKVLDALPEGGSRELRFRHLQPGNYSLRLIEDRNANREWDTGHYLRGRQPEPVHIYPEPLPVRANWELEMPWIIPERINLPVIEPETRRSGPSGGASDRAGGQRR